MLITIALVDREDLGADVCGPCDRSGVPVAGITDRQMFFSCDPSDSVGERGGGRRWSAEPFLRKGDEAGESEHARRRSHGNAREVTTHAEQRSESRDRIDDTDQVAGSDARSCGTALKMNAADSATSEAPQKTHHASSALCTAGFRGVALP
jgi:hypothetical protein